jgi:hypothetical protein
VTKPETGNRIPDTGKSNHSHSNIGCVAISIYLNSMSPQLSGFRYSVSGFRPRRSLAIMKSLLIIGSIAAGMTLGAATHEFAHGPDWSFYGGDAGGTRYSSLDQINRTNVHKLKVAWTYRTGELGAG